MAASDNCEPQYQYGFGNTFSSESEKCPGALPRKQYHPQKAPYGLYTEGLSGTSFTTPRHQNQRSTLYRIRPSVVHKPFRPADDSAPHLTDDWSLNRPNPNQISWLPFDLPEEGHHTDFIHGIKTLCGGGETKTRDGLSIHVYSCNVSMTDKCFYNSDGDFLIVPQLGSLYITTEFGKMQVKPTEIAVIQQGIKFQVCVKGPTRGYILEVYNNHFTLPDMGAIGTVGLADPRHFMFPVAWFEDKTIPEYSVLNKFQGKLFVAHQDHSPFDVVAWHGNYVPYKYDLNNFLTINSVSYDHIDPSIYTVLTCPSEKPGTAIVDFVIFPQRWIVQEHTFRPAYFHRNTMTEFMGLIYGNVANDHGLRPGGASLHSMMTPHGPDVDDFEKGINGNLIPTKSSNYISFMFETCMGLSITNWAMRICQKVDPEYFHIWQGLKSHFDPHWKPEIENKK